MCRLLLSVSPQRHDERWCPRDVVIVACPDAALAVDLLGPLVSAWRGWERVPIPDPGLWVWEGQIDEKRFDVVHRAWRTVSVYELEAVVQGRNPWAPRLVLVSGGNVATEADRARPPLHARGAPDLDSGPRSA